MDDPKILVMRQKIHGTDATVYGAELRQRLPDCDITVAETPAEERKALQRADIVTGLEVTESQLDRAENLKLFACVYAGTGHLDLDAFERHGVSVTNASGVHRTNIAEYVVGAMISMAQQFPLAYERTDRREWRSYPTRELHGSTAAIVGLGAIGQAIADRLDAFGMDTVGVRYSPEKGGPTDEVLGFEEIHEAVADAEYVALACPLTDATRGLIDEEVLMTMPSDAVLVNIARGPVVDTDALLASLQANRLRGAVLDVTDPEPLPEDHPLWGMGNVVITPHNAGDTPEYFARCADILAENVDRLRSGVDELENQVR
ncbi:D-2-hydroxyacid dehydrogenase [Halovenus sp. WSH3]|uniref:D-2-hydroxyacid dehydrogenase n=1 Tax=Halovenus carboxidivorans TaxID=2692199 RepID=A0A6B0T9P0_9EURY|nr:D-2-hydroxyacid dehydrogenase [Halovenus carboxidivorans]MXR52283.1 D-2-hydroxyacid dehydrogenase [Halovenus carboxidivorans]